MFWSALAIVAGLAWLLGRLAWTPLRARHWLLLGLGLTQAPFEASVPVVACLLLLGWRGRMAERVRALRPLVFGALQVALLFVTLVAAGALVFAIQQGLLGTPEMRIAGNGSSSHALRWYLDRSAGAAAAAVGGVAVDLVVPRRDARVVDVAGARAGRLGALGLRAVERGRRVPGGAGRAGVTEGVRNLAGLRAQRGVRRLSPSAARPSATRPNVPGSGTTKSSWYVAAGPVCCVQNV